MQASADLTLTTAHRTALRLLPTSLEFLARQHLAHVVPALIDAGLVGCNGGIYHTTETGRRYLGEHERARAAHTALDALDVLERELREQHNHELGHGHTWTVRGAEVLARASREQVWSLICSVSAHLGIAVEVSA